MKSYKAVYGFFDLAEQDGSFPLKIRHLIEENCRIAAKHAALRRG